MLSFSRVDAQGQARPDAVFGHMGLGGSVALCDREANLSVAVAVNRLSLDSQDVAQRVMTVVYDHYNLGRFSLSESGGQADGAVVPLGLQ